MRPDRAALVAALLALAPGCQATPRPPVVPARPASATGGERGVLLDQLHGLAAEDARAARR